MTPEMFEISYRYLILPAVLAVVAVACLVAACAGGDKKKWFDPWVMFVVGVMVIAAGILVTDVTEADNSREAVIAEAVAVIEANYGVTVTQTFEGGDAEFGFVGVDRKTGDASQCDVFVGREVIVLCDGVELTPLQT